MSDTIEQIPNLAPMKWGKLDDKSFEKIVMAASVSATIFNFKFRSSEWWQVLGIIITENLWFAESMLEDEDEFLQLMNERSVRLVLLISVETDQ